MHFVFCVTCYASSGLFSVEGPYRLQARLRLARLKLELDVERLKIQVLKMREEETACLIKVRERFVCRVVLSQTTVERM